MQLGVVSKMGERDARAKFEEKSNSYTHSPMKSKRTKHPEWRENQVKYWRVFV